MKSVFSLLFLFSLNFAFAQEKIGIFDTAEDIGNPKMKGSSSYDEKNQSYTLKGGGANIWFNSDEFHFLYKKISGDFILTANFALVGNEDGNGHRKTGWMIRETTDADAVSINSCLHGDGLAVLQWRLMRGAYMRDPEEEIFYPKEYYSIIQLERSGQTITMRVAHEGEPFQEAGSAVLPDLNNEVLVGPYALAHDPDDIQEARIWNVRIDIPVANDYHPNPLIKLPPTQQLVLGSRLETMNVSNGERKVIHQSAKRLGAASWSSDGKNLTFNEVEASYSVPVTGGNAVKSSSTTTSTYYVSEGEKGVSNIYKKVKGKETQLTFNTRGRVGGPEAAPNRKYVYYNDNSSGTMQIWRMKPDGSGKEQLTFDQYHNWFPHISPDGKWLVYMALPEDIDPNALPSYKQVTLKLMPTSGGAPRVISYLYGGAGTLDSPCWSPDSKSIVFVSNTK